MGVGEAVIQLDSDVVVGHVGEQAKISKAGYQRCGARQARDRRWHFEKSKTFRGFEYECGISEW